MHALPLQGLWVWSLVRETRTHILHGKAKIIKKKKIGVSSEWDRTDKELAFLGLKFNGSGEVEKQKPRWKLSVNNKIIIICNMSSEDGNQRTEMRETEGSSFRWEKLCKEALFNQNVTWDTKVNSEGLLRWKKNEEALSWSKAKRREFLQGEGIGYAKILRLGRTWRLLE